MVRFQNKYYLNTPKSNKHRKITKMNVNGVNSSLQFGFAVVSTFQIITVGAVSIILLFFKSRFKTKNKMYSFAIYTIKEKSKCSAKYR